MLDWVVLDVGTVLDPVQNTSPPLQTLQIVLQQNWKAAVVGLTIGYNRRCFPVFCSVDPCYFFLFYLFQAFFHTSLFNGELDLLKPKLFLFFQYFFKKYSQIF
jgi:hypothetical protein